MTDLELLGDVLETAGMLADRLRPIVLAKGDTACLNNSRMIPLHKATVTTIYMHLERLAALDGETTRGCLDWAIADQAHD